MWQREGHMEELYESVSRLQGDPIRFCRQYRYAYDLYGRTPWAALVDSGMYCIEAVLIGPDVRAAEMLAAEPGLYAAATYRVLNSHDLDTFSPHVRALLAQADSITATNAVDGILNGR